MQEALTEQLTGFTRNLLEEGITQQQLGSKEVLKDTTLNSKQKDLLNIFYNLNESSNLAVRRLLKKLLANQPKPEETLDLVLHSVPLEKE